MNILILGSGGREHAFAKSVAKSSQCEKLFIAPGNAGTSACGTNVNLNIKDFPAIAEFCRENKIQMLIPGSEDPLVAGITDYMKQAFGNELMIIGPDQLGAQLEGSKDYAKAFMDKYSIPTASYKTFTKETLSAGLKHLETLQAPYVLKADGLAAGKGVVIPETLEEAKTELTSMLADAKFGDASSRVVIEQFLDGIEVSVFVLTDGKNYKLLPEAKDYKRIGEGNTGLNTGGMGAISPVPFADSTFLKKVENRIVRPTIQGLQEAGSDYKGFIFIGLMNMGGEPYVIEYNVRMGDPETEAVFSRLDSDLLELLIATGKEELATCSLNVTEQTAATVVLVSGGYPESYEKGKVVSGLNEVPNSIVYHAGTKSEDDQVLTSGGRVFAVTSLGEDLATALKTSYDSAERIAFDKKYFRKDIGQDLLNLSQS